MWRRRKNKSILSILHDRELNNKYAPYFLSVSVVSRLLRSDPDSSLYNNNWKISSNQSIAYDYGYLYFSNYTQFGPVFGQIDKPPPIFKMQKGRARRRVSDTISYSIPVYKNIDGICKCESQSCTCLSQFVLSVSEDNWLCQHVMSNGKLIKEIYVNRKGHKFSFKYCDWDVYGERFILTSTLDPGHDILSRRRPDVVVNLAIFTVFPVEFVALLEIKRSVFGMNCTAVNVSDQHLIIGSGTSQVYIFSFEDFLKEGNLIPYKLGDSFGPEGKIGSYPTGLPLNFTYNKAPPLLFNVQCFGQEVQFGGYPYHYITSSVKNHDIFTVKGIESCKEAKGSPLTCRPSSVQAFSDMTSLMFHPDQSNRLLFKGCQAVDCYKLSHENDVVVVSKLFSMGFSEDKSNILTAQTSKFGRKIIKTYCSNIVCNIFSIDYACDLDLIAILGVQQDNPTIGHVRLYDSVTGEKVRTFKLKDKVYDYNFYSLYMDMGTIIIVEKKTSPVKHIVRVYNL